MYRSNTQFGLASNLFGIWLRGQAVWFAYAWKTKEETKINAQQQQINSSCKNYINRVFVFIKCYASQFTNDDLLFLFSLLLPLFQWKRKKLRTNETTAIKKHSRMETKTCVVAKWRHGEPERQRENEKKMAFARSYSYRKRKLIHPCLRMSFTRLYCACVWAMKWTSLPSRSKNCHRDSFRLECFLWRLF